MADPIFVIRKNSAGDYYFYLRAANGEIIATSESYKSKDGAKTGIASVKKNAPIATIVDVSDTSN